MQPPYPILHIGIDVGGTFTDLVAWDGVRLHTVKVPSTPPQFEDGVIAALCALQRPQIPASLIHGSTVATNALLQRQGSPIAFVTNDGFRDMLLIGRQNRPQLYALHVRRPPPITPEQNFFTVPGRIAADGQEIIPLPDTDIDRIIQQIKSANLQHVAICLLFSFINPTHELRLAQRCQQAGLTVSASHQIIPEFREYERASTTAINAALRPIVREYLHNLAAKLSADAASIQPAAHSVSTSPTTATPPNLPIIQSLRIMHSAGGTLSIDEAQAHAARLVLSGPAGGVLGAAHVAQSAGFTDIITYDMGGTSTDVATIIEGRPQFTTQSTIDGLPIALPMFDIHTVGAGGGSIAYIDPGGALRVGPRSAGADPGPACYGRGGREPTVTDANLLLGRLLPDRFLGGAMPIHPQLAHDAIAPLASRLKLSPIQAAIGILRIAEANMARAIRAVTSQRGHDPRQFTLVSFGGAGGLHAAAIADALDIPRILIPPNCGLLSALGMVVAPPVADASRTVVHINHLLDDDRLAAEFGTVSAQTMQAISYEQTAGVEVFADARFKGQSHELRVRMDRPSRELIEQRFREAYQTAYGNLPQARELEIVTLRVRRIGRALNVVIPALSPGVGSAGLPLTLLDDSGSATNAHLQTRQTLRVAGPCPGPLLLVDMDATAYIPSHWQALSRDDGSVLLERR